MSVGHGVQRLRAGQGGSERPRPERLRWKISVIGFFNMSRATMTRMNFVGALKDLVPPVDRAPAFFVP